MPLSQRILIIFGLICLLLGSFVFAGHSMWGIMVDVLQGLLYVASGLFAIAAVMRGPTSVHRFSLALGLVFSLVFFVGILNGDGLIFNLFRVNGWENTIHLVFAVSLLFLATAEQYLAQRFAPAKRIWTQYVNLS